MYNTRGLTYPADSDGSGTMCHPEQAVVPGRRFSSSSRRTRAWLALGACFGDVVGVSR